MNRRDLLATACWGSLAAISGCRDKIEPVPEATETRSSVPIQLLLVGTEQEAQTIRRAWLSIDEQPLEITTIAADRTGAASWLELLRRAAVSCDLIVYPLMAAAELWEDEAIVPLDDKQFEAMQEEYGAFFPAPRNAAARFAGEFVAAPLGARLPAVLSTRQIPVLGSWADYDSWVATELGGKASEPLAAGWAAAMFLWRAVSTVEQGWLFNRDDFTPLVATEPYVEVLDQMLQTAGRYPRLRMSPAVIWKAIQKGELLGGIGFPGEDSDLSSDESGGATEVTLRDLPGDPKRTRLMLDPFSPVASISSHCRQTAVSKRLINWLSGGEGSHMIRRQIGTMTPVRSEKTSLLVSEIQSGTPYEQWLSTLLRSPNTAASLQLFAADEYYTVLDQQIVSCLDGESQPAQTLAAVAEKWQAITDRIGTEKQKTAWRRSQGLRA